MVFEFSKRMPHDPFMSQAHASKFSNNGGVGETFMHQVENSFEEQKIKSGQ